ncbi:MAG: c-type cytochrome domain-containing protein [Fuerstiella sp.]
MRQPLALLILTCLLTSHFPTDVSAALPPEVRKELTELSRELRGVSSLVRKKEVDEAKALIRKVEDRVTEMAIAEDERDRSYTSLMSALQRAKASIPISFEEQVAPIVREKCLGCHGENRPRAGLRLDTYANMGRGGQNGPLLIPRNPRASLIMARLTTPNEQARMPKNGERLSDEELNIIGKWIAEGAGFDGSDMTAMIGDSKVEKKPPVRVVMADGSETVSFKDDVAPWMVNVCMGCHSGNRARGGYNISTFEQLLTDGDTGSTIVPGDPDSSYIVDLVLRQEPIKMPAGNQVAIKESQAMALEKWIAEGAHFDGTDPKAPLRALVPTPAEIEAAKLAAMSDAEFSERRMKQAEDIWKRVAPREDAASATSENLYIYGNVPQSRLDQLAEWGEQKVAALTAAYKLPDGEKPWRGRLIVFATKTRFDYEEFNTVLLNRRTPRGVSGHAVVTAGAADAYVALHDIGDEASEQSLNARQLLNSMIAQAYLARSGGTLPDWLQQGFALMESEAPGQSPYMQELPQIAAQAVSTINGPATLFDDGTFAPDQVGAVGYLLTRYLISRGGMPKLSQFARAYQSGGNAGRAIQAAYGQSAADLGRAFLQSGGR